MANRSADSHDDFQSGGWCGPMRMHADFLLNLSRRWPSRREPTPASLPLVLAIAAIVTAGTSHECALGQAAGQATIAASAAAALSHYSTVCNQVKHSGQIASIPSEGDRLIAFGIKADAAKFHELFVAEFVSISHEIRSVGYDAWCEAYAPVALVATRSQSAHSIAGSRSKSIQRK